MAWGDRGEVSVTHNAGYETQHLPFVERQEGDIDEGIYEVPEGATTLHEDEEYELE